MHDPIALLADSEDARRRALGVALSHAGCVVRDAADFASVNAQVRRLRPGVVLLGFSGAQSPAALRLIEQLHAADRHLPIIVVVDGGSERLAVSALRAGVRDYFTEPFVSSQVADSARRCLRGGVPHGRGAPAMPAIVTAGGPMQQINRFLADVAQHDSTVLITGETGTGKELAAAIIHASSRRARAPLVSVNCAAIPDGLLETELFGHEPGAFTGATGRRDGLLQSAHGGTIFLDEIGDMGPVAQAKILRAIETRQVCRVGGKHAVALDFRLVAATNHDLETAVAEGRFRKDLYFRLNVARVHLPPLRERRSDIVALLDHYLRALNQERGAAVEGFTREAQAALENYDWPGNVRELKNLVEAIFVMPPAHPVAIDDLPHAFRQRLQQVASRDDRERRELLDALIAARWNKSRVAEMLHWSRMTVYRKMAKHAIIRRSDPHQE